MEHGLDLTSVLRVKRCPVWEDEISSGRLTRDSERENHVF